MEASSPAHLADMLMQEKMAAIPAMRPKIVESWVSTYSAEQMAQSVALCATKDLSHLLACGLDAGCSPSVCVKGNSALYFAVQARSTRCLRVLLERGADTAHRSPLERGGRTVLQLAADTGYEEGVKLLLEAGADANDRDTANGLTALAKAACAQSLECMRLLLPHTDLSLRSLRGDTHLHMAVSVGFFEGFELLLAATPDSEVDAVTTGGLGTVEHGLTALHIACQKGLLAFSKALLKRGASRTAAVSTGWTPLMATVQVQAHLACTLQLLGKPEARKMTPDEVNAVDRIGFTALHYASAYGWTTSVGALLMAGARRDAVSRQGHTPLQLAQLKHPLNAALLALLQESGAALTALCCDGCGAPEKKGIVKLRACTGCLNARYCGDACQRAAWKGHKKECERLREAREKLARPITTAEAVLTADALAASNMAAAEAFLAATAAGGR